MTRTHWLRTRYQLPTLVVLRTIATPTPAADRTVRGIIGANPAGDWVVYGIVDPNQQHWELWAVNVLTHEHRLIHSATQENSQAQWDGIFVTDEEYGQQPE